MDERVEARRYLPLTETTYYILLALTEPLHGYGVMQKVKELSEGEVDIGPGTLYGAFSTLRKQDLIHKVHEGDRRKVYALTPKGKQVLQAQVRRLEMMARAGVKVINDLG